MSRVLINSFDCLCLPGPAGKTTEWYRWIQ